MEIILKQIFLLLLLAISLFAEATNSYMTQKLLDSKIPIIDVRTPPEWKQTGLLKGAIPIMFFDQNGQPQINSFLQKLQKNVDTTKTFAIICHTGARTSVIAPWLSEKLHYKVINILGGMDYATQNLKLKTYPLKK